MMRNLLWYVHIATHGEQILHHVMSDVLAITVHVVHVFQQHLTSMIACVKFILFSVSGATVSKVYTNGTFTWLCIHAGQVACWLVVCVIV